MRKRVLITGITGFLGSHLAKALLAHDYEVFALKRAASSLSRIESIINDINLYDIDDIDSLFRKCGKIDTIIHTATCYGRNNEKVSDVFAANIEFPLRLLEAGNHAGVETFLNADTTLNKYLNPYSLSKNQFLELGKFFSMRKKMRFWNVKLQYIYGPNDDPSKFSAYVINSCLENISELKLTKGEQKRDFIHIDDVISAYMCLLREVDNLNNSFVEFEVGTGHSISIREFVETVHRLTNSRTLLTFGSLPYRDGEVMQSKANTTALKALGWHCLNDFETALNMTIEQERVNI